MDCGLEINSCEMEVILCSHDRGVVSNLGKKKNWVISTVEMLFLCRYIQKPFYLRIKWIKKSLQGVTMVLINHEHGFMVLGNSYNLYFLGYSVNTGRKITEYLLRVSYCAEYFTNAIAFNPHIGFLS